MKNRSGEKIKLASIDELLGVVNEESAMEIEISKIHPFKNHPFKVLDDEKMQDLVESVKINGVLTPVLLRIEIFHFFQRFHPYSTYKGFYFNDERSTFISSNEWRNTYEPISYRKIYSIKEKTEKSNTGTISRETWCFQ